MDRTGFISLLLWDREATKLIGKSANELNESSIEDPDFNCEQVTDADTTFKDSMTDNEMTSPAKTPAKRSREEDGTYVVEVDDDLAQFSSNKIKRVIKQEKNP
ncbi:uncharacterized protein [Nicotiana tomentosiformis]|uniref:uncharacterized protein n=1 Tax=Nicotiana tomentosiformis TaxID=4098 RepID=UPI00051C36E5|nr:uncharacterized protein LOC104094493 [Nicotiana tomentosiformis]